MLCSSLQAWAWGFLAGHGHTGLALETHCCEYTRGHGLLHGKDSSRADHCLGLGMEAVLLVRGWMPMKSPVPITLLLSLAVSRGVQPQRPEPQPALSILHCLELGAFLGNASLWDLWTTAHSLYWDGTVVIAALLRHGLPRVGAWSIPVLLLGATLCEAQGPQTATSCKCTHLCEVRILELRAKGR